LAAIERQMSRRWPLLLGLLATAWAYSDLLMDSFDYSNAAYWEQRYTKQANQAFEWYGLKWPLLKPALGTLVQKGHRILHMGTGNSPVPEEMHRDGYLQQVAVDISGAVISQMASRLGHLAPSLEFQVEDALNTSFGDASFDVVLEKGTMEAVGADRNCALFDEGCEMVPPEKALALEALRLLRPGGLFVSVADEFKAFPELWAQGLERVEKVEISEKDGIPVPKQVFLLFKASAPAEGSDGRLGRKEL